MDLPVGIQLSNAPIDGVGVPPCAALTRDVTGFEPDALRDHENG
jgi:hypothetical protein